MYDMGSNIYLLGNTVAVFISLVFICQYLSFCIYIIINYRVYIINFQVWESNQE